MSRRIAKFCILMGALLLIAPLIAPFLHLIPVSTVKGVQSRLLLPVPVQLTSLNPQRVLSYPEKTLMLLFFSRLVSLDDELQVQPDLLESWSYEVAKSRIIFKLRTGVYFHDGSELTTDDVIFSFHRWAEKLSLDSDLLLPIRGVKEYQRGSASKISGIQAMDKQHFAIELDDWTDTIIRILSLPRFCVYPRHFRGRPANQFFQFPIGTGPYRVLTYSPQESVFDAFAAYHLGAPRTPIIEVKFLADDKALTAFEKKEINNLLMYDVTPRSSYSQDPTILISKVRSTSTLSLINRAQLTSMQSLSLRKRIADKIQKESLRARCFPEAMVAENFIPPGMLGAPPVETPVSRIQAGKGMGTAPYLYVPVEDPNSHCIFQYLQETFADTPIIPKKASYNDLFSLLKREALDLWIEFFQFKGEDPLTTLQYFSATSNEYLLGLRVPELERFFQSLSRTSSEISRAALYREIDRYLVSNSYVTPLVHIPSFTIVRRQVKGLESLNPKRFVSHWHKIYVEVE